MSKWKRFQRREAVDLRGRVSESHRCIDCGADTAPGNPSRAEVERAYAAGHRVNFRYDLQSEVYMVHPHVWAAAGMRPWGGCLCVGCLERRLGRKLIPDDFQFDHVFNTDLPGTRRLQERQGRWDPLGEYEEPQS
jgi:hypothetical protein